MDYNLIYKILPKEIADYISEYNMYHRILLNTVHKELHYYYNSVYIVHMNSSLQYIKYY